MLLCLAFLGDLTPKGEKYGSKQVSSKGGEKLGRRKRENHGFRGSPSRHWMVVSIQASISGSIRQFLQIYACFDCVVINHQKGRDWNEHGTIYVISSDFGDRMTTQLMELMVLLREHF